MTHAEDGVEPWSRPIALGAGPRLSEPSVGGRRDDTERVDAVTIGTCFPGGATGYAGRD
jgi:hypothetical protein